jgi:hypothetical protein
MSTFDSIGFTYETSKDKDYLVCNIMTYGTLRLHEIEDFDKLIAQINQEKEKYIKLTAAITA